MRASLLTRAGSLAAAAVIATTGAMAASGVAGAAPAAHKRHSTSLSIAKAAVKHSHFTVIAGQLTSGKRGLAGKLVYLDRVTAISLTPVKREHTIRGGFVLFVVSPAKTTRYELVFPGTPGYHSSHSKVVTVKP
jgi:hypothetical protein